MHAPSTPSLSLNMSRLEQTVGALPNKVVLLNGCSQVLKLERRTVGSAPVIGLFRHSEENPACAEVQWGASMSDGIKRMIGILEKDIWELEKLIQNSLKVAKTQLSHDTEEYIVHRAQVINSEVDLLRKQIETIIKQSE